MILRENLFAMLLNTLPQLSFASAEKIKRAQIEGEVDRQAWLAAMDLSFAPRRYSSWAVLGARFRDLLNISLDLPADALGGGSRYTGGRRSSNLGKVRIRSIAAHAAATLLRPAPLSDAMGMSHSGRPPGVRAPAGLPAVAEDDVSMADAGCGPAAHAGAVPAEAAPRAAPLITASSPARAPLRGWQQPQQGLPPAAAGAAPVVVELEGCWSQDELWLYEASERALVIMLRIAEDAQPTPAPPPGAASFSALAAEATSAAFTRGPAARFGGAVAMTDADESGAGRGVGQATGAAAVSGSAAKRKRQLPAADSAELTDAGAGALKRKRQLSSQPRRDAQASGPTAGEVDVMADAPAAIAVSGGSAAFAGEVSDSGRSSLTATQPDAATGAPSRRLSGAAPLRALGPPADTAQQQPAGTAAPVSLFWPPEWPASGLVPGSDAAKQLAADGHLSMAELKWTRDRKSVV